MKKRKLLGLALAILLILIYPLSAFGETKRDALIDVSAIASYPEKPEVSADAIILIEAKSGTVLFSKNADDIHYPASITKIMTALLVIENCSLDEIVTFSYRATHELEAGSSSIARTEGEMMSVKDCLYALLVASANEVAQALAEHVSGSFEAFAELMNKRAEELGCTNTHFSNPSGLHSDSHYTTCHDMAIIMAEAIKNPTFVTICSTPTYTIPATNKHDQSIGIAMKHELLKGSGKYEYAVCGKTGYTSKAKFTLATYAKKDNMDLICITLNCDDSSERATATKTLFNYGFSKFSVYNVVEADPSLGGSDSGKDFLNKNLISLSVPEDSYLVLPMDTVFGNLTSRISWNDSASESGIIAQVDYYSGQNLVGSAPLTVDMETEDAYKFLIDGSYELPEAEIEETTLETAQRLIIIAIIVVAALVVLGTLANLFINGKRKKQKRRKTKISHNVKKFK